MKIARFEIAYNKEDDEVNQRVALFLEKWNNSEDYIETMTSGSTGQPKLIRLKKEHMVQSAKNTLDYLNIRPGTNALLCLSPETIAGKMMIVRSIVGKMKLILGNQSSNPLENMNEVIELMALVPMQLQKICAMNHFKLSNIKKCIVGGGPVTEQTINFLKQNKLTVYHSYGMTETISHVAMRKIGFEGEDSYHAMPGVKFKCDQNQLIIHYPAIGIQHLKTNDSVQLTSETSFLWLGRTDFMINSGGVKINPEGVERILSEILPLPFFVCGLPDDSLGLRLVLIIESENQISAGIDSMKKVLPKYHMPKEIIYIPNFIRTESGKINRFETLKLLTNNVIREIL